MGLAALTRYFDNLTVAYMNEKVILEELATNLTTLTTSNTKMVATIKKLRGDNRQLQQQLKSLKKLPQDEQGPGRRQAAAGRKPATCTNPK